MKSEIENNSHIYCSFKCSIKGQQNGEYKNCLRCGNEFYVRPSEQIKSSSKYCSWECLHPDSELLTIPCYNCGEKFQRYRSRLRKYNFCSKECVNEKQEFGFGIVSKSSSGNIFPSLIEAIFANVLEHLNIDYTTSELITTNRKWTCDFTIIHDDIKYWIEIDGMGSSRRIKYFNKHGEPIHEKIKYYIENNYNLVIISNTDFIGDLLDFLKTLKISLTTDELNKLTESIWKY